MNRLEQNAQRHGALQTLARSIVLAAVLLSPWLFGSADPWAYLFICLIINAGAIVWLASLFWQRRVSSLPLGGRVTGLLLLAYVGVQSVPLPPGAVKALNPIAAEARGTGAAILEQVTCDPYGTAHEPPEPPTRSTTLSASPAATQRSLFLLIAYAAVLFVMTDTVNNWSRFRKVAYPILAGCFLLAVLALLQKLSGTRDIYWFHSPRLGGTIFGSFTNRNHYAAYMNMGFGIALGLMVMSPRWPEFSRMRYWRDNWESFSGPETSRLFLLFFVAVIVGSSVCLSLSRAGIICLAASLGAAGLLVSLRTPASRRQPAIGLLALLMFVTVVWLGWEPIVHRLGLLAAADPLRDSRFLATVATFQIWRTSPFVGCGFGSFQHVFPLFQVQPLQFGRFLHAHNDCAELLAEGGLIGFALALLMIVQFVRAIRSAWLAAPEPARMFLGGAAVGFFAIALHSFIDFSLHKPANALLFATLCGLSAAAVRITASGRAPSSWTPHGRRSVRLFATAAIAGLAVVSVIEARQLEGELAFQRFTRWHRTAERTDNLLSKEAVVQEATREANLVMLRSPGDPDALTDIAIQSLWRVGDYEYTPELRLTLASQAARAAWLAADAAPSDYDCWRWLARTQIVLRQDAQARLCLGRARDLAPPGMNLEKLEKRRIEPGK